MFVLLLSFYATLITSSKYEKMLYYDLFSGYNPLIRPVRNDNDTIQVKIKHTISQILEVNEREELFVTTGWNSLRWHDVYLTWDPKHYNGIKSINLSARLIWLPDIVLYEDFNSDKLFGSGIDEIQNRLSVNYQGDIIWGLKATFITKCHYNVYYFPFDIQTCHLRYGSWSYEKGRIDISPDSHMKIDRHMQHNGWLVLNYSSIMIRRNYTGGTYESVDFKVKFKRKAFFGLANLILSPIIIGILAMLSFVLPAESGERITLSATLLLAMVFFIINVTYLIPNDNTTVPILYKFFIMSLIELLVLNCCIIFSMQLYHKYQSDPQMPFWLRVFILGRLSYYFGVQDELRRNCLYKVIDEKSVDYAQIESAHAFEVVQEIHHSNESMILREWRIVAMTIDKIMLYLFSGAWMATLMLLFIQILYPELILEASY